MKRYLLFFGKSYYPSGGYDDFVNSYDLPELAFIGLDETIKKEAAHYCNDIDYINKMYWYHIVDSETGVKLKSHNE